MTAEETINKSWEELKEQGSAHYKADGGVEPVDLYRSFGAFRHFALCSIIKYAARNLRGDDPVNIKDLNKIIDYTEKLKADAQEEK